MSRPLYGPSIVGKRGSRATAEHRGPIDRCGTYGGYLAHYRSGGKPCGPCTRAHSAYVNQWRARAGRTKNALVPYPVLGALLVAAPTDVEEWAEGVLGPAVVATAIAAWSSRRDEAS